MQVGVAEHPDQQGAPPVDQLPEGERAPGVVEQRRDRDDRHHRLRPEHRHQHQRHQRAGAIAGDTADHRGEHRDCRNEHEFGRRDRGQWSENRFQHRPDNREEHGAEAISGLRLFEAGRSACKNQRERFKMERAEPEIRQLCGPYMAVMGHHVADRQRPRQNTSRLCDLHSTQPPRSFTQAPLKRRRGDRVHNPLSAHNKGDVSMRIVAALLLASTSLFTVGTQAANSADLPYKAARPAPIAAPVWSWNGFYIGAHVGARLGHDRKRVQRPSASRSPRPRSTDSSAVARSATTSRTALSCSASRPTRAGPTSRAPRPACSC